MDVDNGADFEAEENITLFKLKRHSQQEVTLWLDFLFGTILSSQQFDDLNILNPFLSHDNVDLLTGSDSSHIGLEIFSFPMPRQNIL
jgi:hypothetical protein